MTTYLLKDLKWKSLKALDQKELEIFTDKNLL